jgi:predicted transcriptional regulator
MTSVTVELPDDLYQRLQATATSQGTSAEAIAQQWLHERLTRESLSERDLATEVLRQAGLLAELTPAEQARAAQCAVTLDEVRAALGRGGRPLSEIVLEQRGPKV